MSYSKQFAESVFKGEDGVDYRALPDNSIEISNIIGEHLTPYALDDELVKEALYLPFATIYGNDERPYLPKTLAEALDVYTFEATSENEKLFYSLLFKGLNKKLPLPPIIKSLHEHTYTGTQLQPTCVFSCCFVSDESEIVPFNPKNLVKHYKYSELEAKTLFKNVSDSHSSSKFKMLKSSSALKDYWNIRVNQHPSTYACWPTPRLIDNLTLGAKFTPEHIQNIISLAELPLPITHLPTWKRIASRRYERLSGKVFSELTQVSQSRHIVNTIRHNSVYSSIWRRTENQISDEAHHIAFDKTCRKIIQAFPTLANAAKEQLESLHSGKR